MQLIFALLLSIDTDLTSVSTVNIISNVAGRWKYKCDCINKFLIYSTFHKHIALQFIHYCLKQEFAYWSDLSLYLSVSTDWLQV